MRKSRRPTWWRPLARRRWDEAEAARRGREWMRRNAGTVTSWVVTRDGTYFLGQRRIDEPLP